MIIQYTLLLWIALVSIGQALGTMLPLAEQFKKVGYVELCDTMHATATFDTLYTYFDALIAFLHTNPAWAHKIYVAKERFLRSKDRNYYSTDFFGFYDESATESRRQISFYYGPHFHSFLCFHYPECKTVPAIISFLELCREIQKPYAALVENIAAELGLDMLFSCDYDHPPILLKIMKYLPSYYPTKPHYDGTAFSLLLDSTDNQSLLLAAYKDSLSVDDFHCPLRTVTTRSTLLIPGIQLTEFSIYPTPHVVTHSGTIRYATIAFALRPYYTAAKNELCLLPNLNH